MKIRQIYGNYDLHPVKEIPETEGCAWEGNDEVSRELMRRIDELQTKKRKVILFLDCYPGVVLSDVCEFARKLEPALLIEMDRLKKTEEKLREEFSPFLTEDRVFGKMCLKELKDCYETERVEEARKKITNAQDGLIVVAGVGTGVLMDHALRPDLWVYCSVSRWEIQLRFRKGMSSWLLPDKTDPILTKYKKGFFVEWRMADRDKQAHYQAYDYIIDTHEKQWKLVTGEAFLKGLSKLSQGPFRLEPYFDPGVWGGNWMQKQFGLDSGQENFAWSFDGVPEENSINMKFGDVTMKFPAADLVFTQPERLLGRRVYERFGAEFPIRFDLLDTMGGGNLSLQVHPLTSYIREQFGMAYTQDESYYLLDTAEEEETYVYLGVKKGIDRERMAEELREAQEGKKAFPAEEYINKVPVKKHDHILIPAGTLHCSGKNTVVLEISATPYIFTFKLWDWDRVGLDGLPRPIHIEHGLKNIQWERDEDWIYSNLVRQEETVLDGEKIQCKRTGLHELEFIDTLRYELETAVTIECRDSVQMMNLVEGELAVLESTDQSFPPFELHYAETAIVPAGVGSYRIMPVKGAVKVIVASVRESNNFNNSNKF